MLGRRGKVDNKKVTINSTKVIGNGTINGTKVIGNGTISVPLEDKKHQ